MHTASSWQIDFKRFLQLSFIIYVNVKVERQTTKNHLIHLKEKLSINKTAHLKTIEIFYLPISSSLIVTDGTNSPL